ncbi:chromate efflux transporter [Pseudomonas alkylphenolica]|uniref:chromate efflux transporter n=1 Tax=Pseudomonas alkylphenolica TaxID=237609 RepID=UPI0018D92227|nr:chromate efflux transporter [Pseudomonas alkylphenolica]MBH3431135.1 chromate efflux transporter [Pseudomonas alkylphenolica]
MPSPRPDDHTPWQIFLIFLRLGLTSFGGPVAHLGYFRDEFVVRRRWLGEHSYADLVGLCQFLPGPASSQVGIALGLSRAGYRGALAAWAGFTLPSALVLIALALGIASSAQVIPEGVLHGLKVVAVAVVAQAVWGMGRSLCASSARLALMAVVTALVLWMPSVWTQVAVIAGAGVVGVWLFKPQQQADPAPLTTGVSRWAALCCLGVFLALLVGLPLLAALWPDPTLKMVDAFYRSGALVFGGGHVVLPLLQAEVVSSGWVSKATFLAGYGATQAMPGPLFTFAAFLGASMPGPLPGWIGGLLGLVAIFSSSFLLVFGALPFWAQLRHNLRMQSAMQGVNAAVVGLLLAALYQPVWTSAIVQPADVVLALLALLALMTLKLPAWLVVAGCGLVGWWLS